MSDISARLGAMKLIGKLTRSAEGRQFFTDNGFTSGDPIVVAHYDEEIKAVMTRVHSYAPPVTVALVRDDELFLFNIKPSKKSDRDSATAADPRATIGMLYEACLQRGKSETFKITAWDSATPMPDVRKLLNA